MGKQARDTEIRNSRAQAIWQKRGGSNSTKMRASRKGNPTRWRGKIKKIGESSDVRKMRDFWDQPANGIKEHYRKRKEPDAKRW